MITQSFLCRPSVDCPTSKHSDFVFLSINSDTYPPPPPGYTVQGTGRKMYTLNTTFIFLSINKPFAASNHKLRFFF